MHKILEWTLCLRGQARSSSDTRTRPSTTRVWKVRILDGLSRCSMGKGSGGSIRSNMRDIPSGSHLFVWPLRQSNSDLCQGQTMLLPWSSPALRGAKRWGQRS